MKQKLHPRYAGKVDQFVGRNAAKTAAQSGKVLGTAAAALLPEGETFSHPFRPLEITMQTDGMHQEYLPRGQDRGGNTYADPTRAYPKVMTRGGMSGR